MPPKTVKTVKNVKTTKTPKNAKTLKNIKLKVLPNDLENDDDDVLMSDNVVSTTDNISTDVLSTDVMSTDNKSTDVISTADNAKKEPVFYPDFVLNSHPCVKEDLIRICDQISQLQEIHRKNPDIHNIVELLEKYPIDLTFLPELYDWKTVPLELCCEKVQKILKLLRVDADSSKAEWLKERDSYVDLETGQTKKRATASVIADIIKVKDSNSSYNQIFLQKIGLKKDLDDGMLMLKFGTFFEDFSLRLYSKATGKTVIKVGLFVHPKYPFIAGTPDGITLDGITLEAKCAFNREIVPGYVHAKYLCQVQTIMEILDIEENHFVQYRPGEMFVTPVLDITTVKRDKEWFKESLPKIKYFCDQVDQYFIDGTLPECIQGILARKPRALPKKKLLFHGQDVECLVEDDDDNNINNDNLSNDSNNSNQCDYFNFYKDVRDSKTNVVYCHWFSEPEPLETLFEEKMNIQIKKRKNQ